MMPRWATLDEHDRAAFRATTAFLRTRLEERTMIDWALRLKPTDSVKRAALLDLLDSPEGHRLGEPWRSAWRLLEEYWNSPAVEAQGSSRAHAAHRRMGAGERSGALVSEIIEVVAPRIRVEPFSEMHLLVRKLPRRPKAVEDLFSVGLTSGHSADPVVTKLGVLTDVSFLVSLANALDAAVISGLDIARRIGWDGMRLWPLGQLHRVYYVPAAERTGRKDEPDRFNRGIAPSVKLLHAVVSQLSEIDLSTAIEFTRRWRLTNSPVHLRLWGALSRDSRITPANEVAEVLLSLDDQRFWNLHEFPEIAELRARRFGELAPDEQVALTTRIRRLPPRDHWPRKERPDLVKSGRLYWGVRELRRIELTGATLPLRDRAWLASKSGQFAELVQMAQLDEGFLDGPEAHWVGPNPDSRYDLVEREERLRALESALSATRRRWDDDSAKRAADWIGQQGNSIRIIADLESTVDAGAGFPGVWERFGWTHSPTLKQGEDAGKCEPVSEIARVLRLLTKVPHATVRQAIDGISHWLSTWAEPVVALPEGLSVWLKAWPIAVETTNAEQPIEEQVDLNTVAHPSDHREPMDLDTLNTSAGRLVGVFLAACPRISANGHPFDTVGALGTMRDAIIATAGRSGLIARHRMIEALPYFLRADPNWTQEHLLTPLTSDGAEALALWRAIGRRTQFVDVLKIIGGPMSERTVDRRLGRETRQSLGFSLVVECLHSFNECREPAVPYSRIQQMIRSVDDEIRAHCASAIQRFVHEVSAATNSGPQAATPESLFRTAAVPVLRQVWPQERSLATPGVSRALAELPATTRGAFAEAVGAIERFLVPFECWSMLEYGLDSDEDGRAKLSGIRDQEKAAALLQLLDRTIGTSEGAVIPHDLADALEQVGRVGPSLVDTPLFRRLATAARRS